MSTQTHTWIRHAAQQIARLNRNGYLPKDSALTALSELYRLGKAALPTRSTQ